MRKASQAGPCLSAILFLSAVVAALASRVWRRGNASDSAARRAILARRVALAAAVLNLLFVLGLTPLR